MIEQHPTVFLIDDDSDDQEIFSAAMEKANGFAKCIFANDGIQALEKFKANEDFHPDYIFIDMNMPRMNGQQCLAEIKKIERLRDIPVYMYSTSVDPESLEQNKMLGAIDFIVKPSNIHELIAILKNIIHKPVFAIMLLLCSMGVVPQTSFAQDPVAPKIRELKKLSVEELMNIVVTSVSKTPENLSEVASAIQVVTGNDIRRSTSVRLPEALRLAPNLQVTQSGSHDWGISARGFNGAPVASSSLADKLLVMIDGRTVYTPLFGGVYWDVQNVILEDVDRIEVVSGPGGTLWGSNAVNGIVNVITKSADETQGLYGTASYGSFLHDHVGLRYGSQIDSALFFRVYGQRFDYDNSLNADGTDANDSWHLTQGGFQLDYITSPSQSFMLQGELYAGEEDDTLSTTMNGQHLLARWITSYSRGSSMVIQTYFDRTWREITNSPFTDELNTFDLEVQRSLPVGSRNIFLIGAGYRLQDDRTESPNNTFDPARKTLNFFSGFIQDQITLVPERFNLTIGSKFLHNDYTGFEFQPSVRMAWTPDQANTVWAAVSRAVRTPSRFDVDLSAFNREDHPEYKSEDVIAYEIGYRLRPLQKINFSLAYFYNQYRDLRTLNTTGNPAAPFYFGNDMEANTYGIELSGSALISNWWRLRGGYTFLHEKFTLTATNVLEGTELIESISPMNQMLLHSIMDIAKSFQVDILMRYVDDLPAVSLTNTPAVPEYFNLNARIAWEYRSITLALRGQNLLKPSKTEFGTRRIPRSISANITLRL